jgi:multidrug resistance protein
MFAPGVPDIMREFHTTNENLATFVVSIYVLGFAFGPLLAAPLSEIYGRAPCYNIANLLFIIFTVGTALSKNIGMLIAFRFLMGFAGSTPITNGSGTISDMFPVEQRGKAMAVWAMGPLLGPCIGPVAGGFMVKDLDWRWVFWVIAIAVSNLAQPWHRLRYVQAKADSSSGRRRLNPLLLPRRRDLPPYSDSRKG